MLLRVCCGIMPTLCVASFMLCSLKSQGLHISLPSCLHLLLLLSHECVTTGHSLLLLVEMRWHSGAPKLPSMLLLMLSSCHTSITTWVSRVLLQTLTCRCCSIC